MKTIQLKAMPATHTVSPLLYGIFLEDINFACDGGLSSNLVANHSFDGKFIEKSANQMDIVKNKKAPEVEEDFLRYWNVTGGTLESCTEDGASKKNPYYAEVTSERCAVLANRGHDGRQDNLGKCSISIVKGHEYQFSCYLRSRDYKGRIFVRVVDEDGMELTSQTEIKAGDSWQQIRAAVQGLATAYGQLTVVFEGQGSVDLDCIVFQDADVWGKDDPKWTGGHFRKDLVESIQNLHPSFMRFPGGCIVEGLYRTNEYQWKNTVGPVLDRVPAVNLWGAAFEEKGYCQSNQIGFYEYFLLCEDLHMEPLPIVWAGLNCQFRSNDSLDTDSEEFQRDVVQNALDLIEYANGDPAVSPWAKLRAEAGHPEPFNMKMIGIGNENYGADYHEKFRVAKAAVQEKYPDMICIMSSGALPEGEDFEETWRVAKAEFPDVRIDEHFYSSNDWVYSQVNRYDHYERGTAQVFLGEWAANDVMRMMDPSYKPNTFGSALAEAAFLTGIERNSDVVAMTSYAPLFSMIKGNQWNHNMIWFNQQTHMLTANYYVQQMYGANLGKEYLPLEGNIPEKSYFSLTADERAYYLKGVNASEEAVSVTIKLNQAKDGDAEQIVLHSDDLQVANEISFMGEPVYQVAPVKSKIMIKDGMLCAEMEANSVQVWIIKK